MPPTRSRPVAPLLVVPLLLATSLLAACGVRSDDDPSTRSTPSATPQPTDTDSATPSESPSATDSPTATPTPSATVAPRDALLTAAELPALDDTARWKPLRTGPVTSRPFGVCAKFDVLSIGAERAVQRGFAAGSQGAVPDANAAQQVVSLPDATTTARVQQVLRAWHDSCARRSPGGGHDTVGPITSVPVSRGTGWWYLVSYRTHPGLGASHPMFESFGVAVSGSRMTLLRMDHAGQDHRYPPGQDPMELAVKTAAGKLG